MIGYTNASGGGGVSSDDVTATRSDILAGKRTITSDSNDEVVEGTLTLSGNASTSDVLSGKTFYNTDAKAKQTGTLALSGNATAADVLSGKTFYNTDAKSKQTGTMPNRGNVDPTIGGINPSYPYASVHKLHNDAWPQITDTTVSKEALFAMGVPTGYWPGDFNAYVAAPLEKVRSAIGATNPSKWLNDTVIANQRGTIPIIGAIDPAKSVVLAGDVYVRMSNGAHITNASSGYPEVSFNLATLRSLDGNLQPWNIKKGVTIFGTVGTHEGYIAEANDLYKYGANNAGLTTSNPEYVTFESNMIIQSLGKSSNSIYSTKSVNITPYTKLKIEGMCSLSSSYNKISIYLTSSPNLEGTRYFSSSSVYFRTERQVLEFDISNIDVTAFFTMKPINDAQSGINYIYRIWFE